MLSTLFSLALLAARPDVVLVTIDTLRADRVGAYGSLRGASPAIDALGASGVVVLDAVVQVPMTRPSHASLMTGLLPYQHGIRDNASPPLASTIPTLASSYRAAGYATAAFIGAFPVSRGSGLENGFETYDDPFVAETDATAATVDRNERPAREVIDAALAWLAKPDTRPRFIWVHLFEPHYPYEPLPPFDAKFRGAPYDGEVATADRELKRLLDRYPPGPARLVVVTSDHGEGLGEHGEDEHHLFVYDSTLRVPLILAGADLPRGGKVRGQFRSIDLMPTLLDLTGAAIPKVTGASRAVNLRGGNVIPDNESYAESLYGSIHFGYAPVRALRGEGFKYIDTPRPELYRVASDPAEATDLSAARAPLAAAMQKRLRQMHGEGATRPSLAAPVSAAAQERLAALGYVAGGPASAPSSGASGPDPKDRVVPYRRYSRAINDALKARRALDPAGVVRALLPVAKEFGGQASVSNFLGEALLETRRFAEAIPYLEKARDAAPGSWRRWGRLAEALSGAGRVEDALVALARGLAVAPRQADLIRLRVALLTRSGRAGDAAKTLEAASAADPDNAVLLAELASLRRNSGDLAAAESLSQKAAALSPGNSDVWLSRGLVLGATGRAEQAAEAFSRAASLDPTNVDAWFYAAAAELQRGDRSRALESLARVRRLDPRRPGLADLEAAARRANTGPTTPAARPAAPASGSMTLRLVKAATRAEAQALRARLAKGDDLSALEQDLGVVRLEDLRPPLNTAAAALVPGGVSPVLETRDGFVILRRPR